MQVTSTFTYYCKRQFSSLIGRDRQAGEVFVRALCLFLQNFDIPRTYLRFLTVCMQGGGAVQREWGGINHHVKLW